MRKVEVSKYTKEGKIIVGYAVFHQFGVSYDEYENGPGNYSTAIIEWDNGQIESVYADNIRFIS